MKEQRMCANKKCKRPFEADRLEETRAGGKKKKFCSRECERGRTKERDYRGPEWEGIRKRIIARDGGKCALCPATEPIGVHHIEPYHIRQNNEESNLITLCQTHHVREESRMTRFGKPSPTIRRYMKSLEMRK